MCSLCILLITILLGVNKKKLFNGAYNENTFSDKLLLLLINIIIRSDNGHDSRVYLYVPSVLIYNIKLVLKNANTPGINM